MSKLYDMSVQTLPHSVEAEHGVLGALLLDNEAIYRIADLAPDHFYHPDNGKLFAEIRRQISAGMRCDVVTLFEAMQNRVADCLVYLNSLATSTPGSANIERYASIIIEKAQKRALIALGGEIASAARGGEGPGVLIDSAASKLEALARNSVKQEPALLADMLATYADRLQDRIDGKITSIRTGFKDLDKQLDGGLERGTLTVLAARPGMGKTAMGLSLARNVCEWGGTSLFLSMEMSKEQINDRNIGALGKVPVAWLRKPDNNQEMWDRVTDAFKRVQDLKFYIDDQTALNLLDIRAKARLVKRRMGLDLLIIDQLSFLTGGTAENKAYEIGEYTRALTALAKELDCAVVLLAQLNRKCEERSNKRPLMSDLSSSGSIEQDAANVIFLYRDELYDPTSPDKGICEVIVAKQRQGEPGTVALTYVANQTRFEECASLRRIYPAKKELRQHRGFD